MMDFKQLRWLEKVKEKGEKRKYREIVEVEEWGKEREEE